MQTSELRPAAATGVLQVGEQRTIDDVLSDLQQQLSSLLSPRELSHDVSVAPRAAVQSWAPLVAEARVKHLELLSVRDAAVLLVLVLQGGLVQEQMLMVADPFSQEQLSRTAAALNRHLEGRTAAEVDQAAQTLPSGLERDAAEATARLMAMYGQQHAPVMYHNGRAGVLDQRARSMAVHAERRERPQVAHGMPRPLEMLEQELLLRRHLLQPSRGTGRKVVIGDDGEGP